MPASDAMNHRYLALFALLFCLSTPSYASCELLVVGKYFDGIQMNPGPTFLLVENGRIQTLTQTTPKNSCEMRDLRAYIVAPGFIDTHTHLFLHDSTRGKDFSKALLEVSAQSPESRLTRAKMRARELLLRGVTTVRDLGNSPEFLERALAKSIETGKTQGPRLIYSGPGFAVESGQFAKGASEKLIASEYQIVKPGSDIPSLVLRYKAKGATWIKVYADNEPGIGEMSEEILKSIVKAARAEGLRVAAHATNEASSLRAVKAGVNTIEHGYALNTETLSLMAKKKIFLVPTDLSASLCAKATCFPSKEVRLKRIGEAKAAGVLMAFGADAYAAVPELDRGQMSLEGIIGLVEEGISPLAALQMATSKAAELLGREDIGHIRPGDAADLIAFAKDPTADIQNIKSVVWVMKSGVTQKSLVQKK